jgi:hypothetical protein
MVPGGQLRGGVSNVEEQLMRPAGELGKMYRPLRAVLVVLVVSGSSPWLRVKSGQATNMARTWASQPPGAVVVRLNIVPETRLHLSQPAGSARVSIVQFVRRLADAASEGRKVSGSELAAEMRQEKPAQLGGGSARPMGGTKKRRRPSKLDSGG